MAIITWDPLVGFRCFFVLFSCCVLRAALFALERQCSDSPFSGNSQKSTQCAFTRCPGGHRFVLDTDTLADLTFHCEGYGDSLLGEAR
jgi:hypothetical protein